VRFDGDVLKDSLGEFERVTVHQQVIAGRYQTFQRRQKLRQVMALHRIGCDRDGMVEGDRRRF